jgi:hypothetical protein
MIDLLWGGLGHARAARSNRLLAILPLALLALVPVSAKANTYRPTRTNDPSPNGCKPRDCSLREAITKANNHAGLDTVVLRGGKTYTLGLDNVGAQEDVNASGDLDVLGSNVIKSSNRRLATVDANGIDRVFDVGPSTAVSATFTRITIRNGSTDPDSSTDYEGGGIATVNGGLLKLIKSKIAHNRAEYGGGISAAEGTLKLVRTTVANNRAFDGYGGGIADERPGGVDVPEVVSLSRSKLVGNSAFQGSGGMYTENDTTITKSTIANNRADAADAGGLELGDGLVRITGSTISGNRADTFGGGIDLGTDAILINDTIANNSADGDGGGIYFGGGASPSVTMNAVTVARNSAGGNGGGLVANGFGLNPTMTLSNSLVGLNSAGGSGPDCHDPSSDILSGGHNLIGTTAAAKTFSCAPAFVQPGDRTNLNPRIKRLDDNGGPTKTIALQRRSQAINHAGNDSPNRDQRGTRRKDPDIGAFERR